MRKLFLPLALLLAAITASSASQAQTPDKGTKKPTTKMSGTLLAGRVDWQSFLARHDLVWETLPDQWHEGAFLGDGRLGAMIYRGDNDALRWDVNRSDVTDRGNRLAIGQLVMAPVGKPEGGTMRLDLWNAEATGTLQTNQGQIAWRSLTHAMDRVIVVETTASPGEQACRWERRALPAVNPRRVARKETIPEAEKNPEPTRDRVDDVFLVVQPLQAGAYVVAWREVTLSPGRRLLFLSIGKGDALDAQTEAVGNVQRAAASSLDKLLLSHRDWWHAYYPASFVSVPDTRLESFYWIQMYKLGAAVRPDGPALDLMGPWFRTTPWPRIWWNLNIQLTYWPVYASNRLALGESLTTLLDRNVDNLINNVPEAFRKDSAAIDRATSYDCRGKVGKEIGNLTWTLHNYWLQYRHSMDEVMLRERLFPLLRRSINYYLHLLENGDDGKLHLPVAISPEYPKEAPDTSYDLSLLRWGCRTLIAIGERLKIDDPLLPRWKETLETLTPYPVDAQTGLMIGRGVPLAVSHRHFSHLLMIFPLYLLSPEDNEDRALIEKSLRHWIGFEGALQGYSFTSAASISAGLGKGDDAVKFLNALLDRYVKPNTMYLESGPVIETPLAGAASIHDLLLQSWGDKLRVFPALPAAWPDVTFHNLRAEGAFLVSAVRKNGATQFVRVTSLAGEPCRLQTDLPGELEAVGDRAFVLKTLARNVVEIDLRKGETVLLQTRGTKPDLTIAPAGAQEDRQNFYGSPKTRIAGQGK